MLKIRKLTSALALICLASTVEAASKPVQVVEEVTATLIDVMKNAQRLGYSGRFKTLEPVIKRTHHFPDVARYALGTHWKKLDEAQRARFTEKLAEHSIATYAAQFNGYAGEKFRYLSDEQFKRPDKWLVRYDLLIPGEPTVRFDFLLSEYQDQWMIINIIVDGVSDLALRKAQYDSIIEREGFDSLIARLEQKIADYASDKKPADDSVFKDRS